MAAEKEIPEAPYWFIYDIETIDNRKVKVFRLGRYGKKAVANAVIEKTFFKEIQRLHSTIAVLRDMIGREIQRLHSTIAVLRDVIGRERIVEYLKKEFLRKLKDSSKRRYDLINHPFWFEKESALSQLFKEGKVYRTRNGWIKLKEIDK